MPFRWYHPKNSARAAAMSSTWSGLNQRMEGSEENQVSWRLA